MTTLQSYPYWRLKTTGPFGRLSNPRTRYSNVLTELTELLRVNERLIAFGHAKMLAIHR